MDEKVCYTFADGLCGVGVSRFHVEHYPYGTGPICRFYPSFYFIWKRTKRRLEKLALGAFVERFIVFATAYTQLSRLARYAHSRGNSGDFVYSV